MRDDELQGTQPARPCEQHGHLPVFCSQVLAVPLTEKLLPVVLAVLTTYSSQVSAALQPLALNGSLSPRGALQFHICSPRSSARPTAAVWRQLWMAAMQP